MWNDSWPSRPRRLSHTRDGERIVLVAACLLSLLSSSLDGMDTLLEELERLSKRGNLSKSLEDVQKTIDLLVKARDSISASQSRIL